MIFYLKRRMDITRAAIYHREGMRLCNKLLLAFASFGVVLHSLLLHSVVAIVFCFKGGRLGKIIYLNTDQGDTVLSIFNCGLTSIT